MEYWRNYLPANWTDCSLSCMLQCDWSTSPVDMITSSHCYNDFSGCPFLNAWSSNCASWRIVVSTVLVRTTSRVTLWAYPTCVQDKNYAQRLLQLWWFQLHDIPHLAIGLFLLLLLSCGTHCRATSHLLHHFWLFDINWKHFYFVDLMASDCFDMSVFFVLAFYFLVFIF